MRALPVLVGLQAGRVHAAVGRVLLDPAERPPELAAYRVQPSCRW